MSPATVSLPDPIPRAHDAVAVSRRLSTIATDLARIASALQGLLASLEAQRPQTPPERSPCAQPREHIPASRHRCGDPRVRTPHRDI